jgi:hypothetical protein
MIINLNWAIQNHAVSLYTRSSLVGYLPKTILRVRFSMDDLGFGHLEMREGMIPNVTADGYQIINTVERVGEPQDRQC